LRLLVDLDQQKEKALERNFKTLATNFTEIFHTIVPEGIAELKLVKDPAADESQISHPSQIKEPSQALKLGTHIYKGIKVKVSFVGKGKKGGAMMEDLSRLSGGQKAVVAAALLFSILKIEAAPFYIMDEFDNALDAEFRGAIAQLIFDLSKKSQFLITTFKPELVNGADKLFEVTFINKVSGMKVIDR
jgi:structural maintenance of chromosome 3 (chondroitin sulfate proteoglycan 6)